MFPNRSVTTVRPTNDFPWPVRRCCSVDYALRDNCRQEVLTGRKPVQSDNNFAAATITRQRAVRLSCTDHDMLAGLYGATNGSSPTDK
jgi:hypothetical protein